MTARRHPFAVAAAATLTFGALSGLLGGCAAGPSDYAAPTVTRTVSASAPGGSGLSSSSAAPTHGPAASHGGTSGAPGGGASTGGASSGGTRGGTSDASPGGDTPGTSFTAFGRRTPWRAVVADGVLTTEGPSAGQHSVAVTRSAFSRGVEFTGTETTAGAHEPVSLVITSDTCRDGQGQDTGMTAVLTVGNHQLRGCAVAGAIPHADT